MTNPDPAETSRILSQAGTKDPTLVAKELMPLVYQELRTLAAKYLRRERQGHTLNPTALVHEAYMRMIDQSRVDWQGRTHFYAVCADAMQKILIDHARGKGRIKRGQNWRRVAFENAVSELAMSETDMVEFRDALRKLAELDERQARVVELRLFAGLTMDEISSVLRVSKRTIEGDWTHARAWLRTELLPDGAS
jgi:RNA polymerase sigma-70 factor (ECF subfamily)